MILLRIPVRDRPEVQLKAVAYGALEQRRPNWGYNRKWSGSYLNMPVRRHGNTTVVTMTTLFCSVYDMRMKKKLAGNNE